MSMVRLLLIAEPPSCLTEYGRVPISFQVVERIDVRLLAERAGATSLRALPVTPPYCKDYDAIPGHHPSEWARRWDLSKWWFASGYVDERRVGGVAVVIDTVEMEGAAARSNVAVLWDIRVHPDVRQQGLGRQLLSFAEDHARSRGTEWMKAETQDINVGACRFYARAGYTLMHVNRSAYAQFPDEAQLIWQKRLKRIALDSRVRDSGH
ncbi:MAG: GNAT family N-acetyltransferase [Chthoniobacterales bacterium]|nr:GNAT family N-acetyltransferase [Chthoniobacterales bacterium]